MGYPDYPLRTEEMSIWDFTEAIKKYFQSKDLKHNDDFSDEEKNAIIEDCTEKMIGPKALSQKYNTMIYVIRTIVTSKGFKVTPDDLSRHPNYPRRSDGMSLEEYKLNLRKYHEKYKKQKTKNKKQKTKNKKQKTKNKKKQNKNKKKQKTRNRKQETRNKKQKNKTQNTKHKTQNTK